MKYPSIVLWVERAITAFSLTLSPEGKTEIVCNSNLATLEKK